MASALGRALIDAWGGRVLGTYDAKGWHAQLSALTKDAKGYSAMEAAGISISPKTLMKWLSQDDRPGEFRPQRGNIEKIQRAYDIRRGAWNPANERREYRVKGIIKTGDDVRDRTLTIDGSQGSWTRIRDAYERGELTEDDAEEWFVEDVIYEDGALGAGSDGWEFPGGSYTIT